MTLMEYKMTVVKLHITIYIGGVLGREPDDVGRAQELT